MKTIVFLLATLCLSTGLAFGQDQLLSQASLQVGGLYNSDATASSVTDHSTGSVAVRLSYAYLFSQRTAVEISYAYSRNSQDYLAGGMETAGVQTAVNQYTVALTYRIPFHAEKFHPYALAGTGALQFRPTTAIGNPSGGAPENRGAFVYGAGVDLDVTPHIGVRAEYRGLLYTTPNFALSTLGGGAWTHMAEPSVGAFYRF